MTVAPLQALADALRSSRGFAHKQGIGHLLAVRPAHSGAVQAAFAARGIACADVGEVRGAPQVLLADGTEEALLWDLGRLPFITGGAR